MPQEKRVKRRYVCARARVCACVRVCVPTCITRLRGLTECLDTTDTGPNCNNLEKDVLESNWNKSGTKLKLTSGDKFWYNPFFAQEKNTLLFHLFSRKKNHNFLATKKPFQLISRIKISRRIGWCRRISPKVGRFEKTSSRHTRQNSLSKT